MTSEQPPADDSRRADAKAKLEAAIESVKTEVAARLDQLLDELGALI